MNNLVAELEDTKMMVDNLKQEIERRRDGRSQFHRVIGDFARSSYRGRYLGIFVIS